MEHVPRALANRDTRGLIKVVAREADGRILGVHVLSPAAGEVIMTGVLAVKLGLGISDLAATLFPYLTEVEGLRLAAQTFHRRVEQLSCCAG
jgi:mercuric reductase